MKEKRLITAALPYTNNVPHIGNIVGSHLPADIFTRYCRLNGYDAILIGGTDENGTASEIAAQQIGISCKELCDFFFKIHKEIYDWFQISYDNFSRTSKPIHHKTVKDFFTNMYKNKYIIEKLVKIPFCNACKRSIADRYIVGRCPYCNYESAKGDQCEKCSKLLEPENLINPKCSVCDKYSVEFKEKKHLFLDLKKLSKKLEKWINKNKHWRKQVRNIALSWIKEGLKPRDITRELNWGVDVPIKGYEDMKIYVWAEAAIGYISSTKEWNKNKWIAFWKKKNSKIYHFIGKDNIPFHTILFPAELIAEGSFNLPYNVVGLQYLNYEKSKISKSKGYGIFCENLPSTGLEVDYWRFYLASIIPETSDTEFLWKDFQNRINSELIGNFSNFINRTLSFIWKNFDGKISGEIDKKFYIELNKKIKNIIELYEKVELREALKKILELSDFGNKYFQKNEPWKNKDKKILFNCVNLCKILSLLIQPYLPSTSKKILKLLKCKEKDWKKIKEFNIKKINKPTILFDKLDDKKIKELKIKTSQITKFQINKKTKNNCKKIKSKNKKEEELMNIEDFEKFKIRIGRIKQVKPHPNADKLLILQVDIGNETRQLVAGLKNYYKEKELIGKKIAVIVNLKPATIRGIESNGMLLAAVDDKNNVSLITVDKDINEGSKVE
jgi:methionyl-tRNA synthetase